MFDTFSHLPGTPILDKLDRCTCFFPGAGCPYKAPVKLRYSPKMPAVPHSRQHPFFVEVLHVAWLDQ